MQKQIENTFYFSGAKEPFSPFHAMPFIWNGMWFPCAWSAAAWAKASFMGHLEIAKTILMEHRPAMSICYYNGVKAISGEFKSGWAAEQKWNKFLEAVLFDIELARASQHDAYRAALSEHVAHHWVHADLSSLLGAGKTLDEIESGGSVVGQNLVGVVMQRVAQALHEKAPDYRHEGGPLPFKLQFMMMSQMRA